MRQELLDYLKEVTPEEQAILNSGGSICQELHTSRQEFVVDSGRLLEKGRLVEIRPHTRFAHFPRHRHNYLVHIGRGPEPGGKHPAFGAVNCRRSPLPMVTPYMFHYFIDALMENGLTDQALIYMKAYWGGMIRSGADTFWEL